MKNTDYIIDYEKCVKQIDGNRFDLVLAAATRARQLGQGHKKLIKNDSGIIITALKEIEEGLTHFDFKRKN
jgi:DNA-directed RNA polymerase omega subunit